MSTDRRPDAAFHERVRGGELLLGTFANMASPIAVEICAKAGFDWVLVDLEHGAGAESGLLSQAIACEAAGAVPIVRVESNHRLRISRALDLGVLGVMVPRVDSAADARAVVASLRYPPDGERGVALMTRAGGYGTISHDAVRGLNEKAVGIVQIESAAAVEQVTTIAQVPGVDVLFVGPTDLTHSLGIPGRFDDARYLRASESVVSAALAAGKVPGILVRSPEDARRSVEMGYRFVGIGSDSAFLASGARGIVEALGELRA